MSWWGPMACGAYATSDQALSVASWDKVVWHNRYGTSFSATGGEKELWYNAFGDSKIYIYRTATFVFNYRVNVLIADPQSDTVNVRWAKNGSTYFWVGHAHSGVGTTYHERGVSGSIVLDVTAGDYFELEVFLMVGPNSGTAYISGSNTVMGRTGVLLRELDGATRQEAEITFTSRAGDPNVERGLMGQAAISDASPVRVRQAAASINGTATATGSCVRIRIGKSGAIGRATATGAAKITASASASATGSANVQLAEGNRRRQAAASINGAATASGSCVRIRIGKSGAIGAATAAATSSVYRPGSASIAGNATATGTALNLQLTGATSAVVFGAEALGTLAVQLAFPSIPRAFSGRLAEGSPSDLVSVGAKGDSSVNNLMVVNGANDLGLSLSYSGPDYLFSGPVDVSSSPLKLGFKKGDKVRLTGAGPNGGLEFTIGSIGAVPGTLSVVEDLTTPDATEYQFSVIRRLT